MHHAIDYTGAALLAIALSAITLVADLGGSAYTWTSPMMLGLIATSVLAVVLFIVAERRATEPVLPLRLFGNRAFAVTSAVGLIVGFALFGSVTYLPVFLQVVQGASPTASGLEMIPMMGGVLVTSIVSGQLISKNGRYKLYPIIGTGVMTVGLFLLSRMTASTSILGASLMMLLLGLGLGMVMQVLVIAVQNSVEYRDLGVATSGATLFRLIGGSLGTAVLGAVFAARLDSNLHKLLAGIPGTPPSLATGMNPATLAALPPQVRALYAQAFTGSLNTVFLIAAVIAVCGFALTWLLPEDKLRESVAAAAGNAGHDAGEAFPMATDRDSAGQLVRGLAAFADRDVQRQYIEQIVARAGVDLTPAAAWLLVSIERDATVDPFALGRSQRVAPEAIDSALEQLRSRGLIAESPPHAVAGAPRDVTTAGCGVLGRLAAARRDRIEELFAEWPHQTRGEIAVVLRGLARDLVPEPRPATSEAASLR